MNKITFAIAALIACNIGAFAGYQPSQPNTPPMPAVKPNQTDIETRAMEQKLKVSFKQAKGAIDLGQIPDEAAVKAVGNFVTYLPGDVYPPIPTREQLKLKKLANGIVMNFAGSSDDINTLVVEKFDAKNKEIVCRYATNDNRPIQYKLTLHNNGKQIYFDLRIGGNIMYGYRAYTLYGFFPAAETAK